VEVLYSLDDEVVLAHRAEDAETTNRFFETIADEQGWVPPAGAIEAFPQNSFYFVHRTEDTLLGAVKMVMGNDDEGLPILKTWPELPLAGRTDVAELSIIALAQGARGRGSSFLPLSVEVWKHCVRCGVVDLWAELEPRMVKAYNRFGWPFEVAGELREYWGDPLYPSRMNIEAAKVAFLDKAANQEKYRRVVEAAVGKAPYQSWLCGVSDGSTSS